MTVTEHTWTDDECLAFATRFREEVGMAVRWQMIAMVLEMADVVPAEQLRGVVEETERLRALLRRCYPVIAPDVLSEAIERELGLPPFANTRRSSR